MTAPPAYAELQVTSNYSFLRGASHADELVTAAKDLGLAAIGIADRNTLAGVVRAHVAAKEAGLKLLVGAHLVPEDGPQVLCYPTDRAAYGRLCRLLTIGKRRAEKGACRFSFAELMAHGAGQMLIVLPPDASDRRVSQMPDTPPTQWRGSPPIPILPPCRAVQSHMDTGSYYHVSRRPFGPPQHEDMGGFEGRPHAEEAAQRPSRSTWVPHAIALHRGGGERKAAQSSTLSDHGEGKAFGAHSRTPSPLMGEGRGGGDSWSRSDATFAAYLVRLAQAFPGACFLAAHHLARGDDARRLAGLAALAGACGTPLVACNDVRMHTAGRKALLDVVTCIREHCTIDEAGFRLLANAERHLKPPAEMARLFRDYPEAVSRTVAIAERCRFSLDELRYEYPNETTHDGRSPQEELAHLTWIGARERYPSGVPRKIEDGLRHELTLIGELGYAPYFLTVHDIVRFARSRDILCQGRGSAANSMVCYCLGITAVDPARIDLLFERFVSAERNEPPDIDVDFEHERREEVIQYIYGKYGRDRAGLAATVICYRGRGAIREVGKAMGLSADLIAAMSASIWGWSRDGLDEAALRGLGLNPDDRRLRLALDLTRELIGFPRHLSQHVGGFVMTRGPLDEMVPIENAAMADRTVIEWDKDDLAALRILKVDVLGLGMLTCLRKGFDLLARHTGRRADLASVPAEDPRVYDVLCRADSLGVFQVESRAQMTMLPRLKPRNFYDLVIEVAIVRPGPIQGDMVHPYLRRRRGEEPVEYPSEALREVLGKTLGVPLFQEQAMRIAIVAAGFTPSEADRLRRAMATFRRVGTIHTFRQKLIDGMTARGYDAEFAERCFRQIEGFGEYGFPESHAASFALLVYVSAWLKCHHPAVFAAALLNSQPMGFYAPAQIVRDAREHGVEVRPVDVNDSDWDCTLEASSGVKAGGDPDGLAVRLGLRQVKGLPEAEAAILMAGRGNGYADAPALWRRGGLSGKALEALARADAFRSMGLDRCEALWAVKGLPRGAETLPLFAAARARGFEAEEQGADPAVTLPRMGLSEHVVDDYASLRLSLKAHPVSFLRPGLAADEVVEAQHLATLPDGKVLRVAGLVLVRQRPGTASGVIFATLEDETGIANIVIWRDTFERYRQAVLGARLLMVEGPLQREGLVIHVIARRLIDLSPRLATLAAPGSGDPASALADPASAEPPLRPPHARADEATRPGQDARTAAPNVRRLYPSRDFH